MTDGFEDLHRWLTPPAQPTERRETTSEPSRTPTLPVTQRDFVGEAIVRFNAERAGRPNQLVTPEQAAAIAAAGPPPAKTGDTVADFLAMRRWRDSQKPNPLRGLS